MFVESARGFKPELTQGAPRYIDAQHTGASVGACVKLNKV